MKRIDLIRHLRNHGCELLREGRRHAVYVNRNTGKSSAVTRYHEVNLFTAKRICSDLEIAFVEAGRT